MTTAAFGCVTRQAAACVLLSKCCLPQCLMPPPRVRLASGSRLAIASIRLEATQALIGRVVQLAACKTLAIGLIGQHPPNARAASLDTSARFYCSFVSLRRPLEIAAIAAVATRKIELPSLVGGRAS